MYRVMAIGNNAYPEWSAPGLWWPHMMVEILFLCLWVFLKKKISQRNLVYSNSHSSPEQSSTALAFVQRA